MRAIPQPIATGLPSSGYLLIDPSNVDSGLFGEAPPMHRCTPALLSNADELTPRLIDLVALSPEQQERMRQALLRETIGNRPPVVCAWLASAFPLAELGRHIGRFLVGPGVDGAPVYWRYHDPRVFSLAMQVLAPVQCEALLGPITEWRFPWCRGWWSVLGPGRHIDALEGIAPAWPSNDQWTSLRYSELISRSLAQLLHAQEAGPTGDCVRYQGLALLALQDGRKRLHLGAEEDLLEYAVLCARYGAAFRFHPKLAAAWAALPLNAINWSDARDVLTIHDWQLLDAQLQQSIPTGATK